MRSLLGVHYRSEHQDLIEFSNHAFYNAKLMPIPQIKEYTPIEFHEVNGLYADHTNQDEAKFVISWIRKFIETGEKKSIGVVTLNLSQTDLIKEELANERTIDSDFNSAMIALEENG